MFKQIVYRDGYFYLRRWFFGWEYWDAHFQHGYWWPKRYIQHATKFSTVTRLREEWNKNNGKFKFWSWL